MIRQRKFYGNFTERPPPESSSSDNDAVNLGRPHKSRKVNIYDAVAGNVTQAGLISNITDAKASRQPLRPDEVLFKQSNAPIRYEETDYYFAHERLPAAQQLPSGDLLSALHAYISKLFSRTDGPEMEKAWKCMDETALITFGILMEEMAREVLGETGDLAFTEAADEEEERALANGDEVDEQNMRVRRSAARASEQEEEARLESPSSEDASDYTADASD